MGFDDGESPGYEIMLRRKNTELVNLQGQLDYYARNIRAHREMGEACSMACLYCEYVDGTLQKLCPTHAELDQLRAKCNSLTAENRELVATLNGARGFLATLDTFKAYEILKQLKRVITQPHTAREVERVKALEAVAEAARVAGIVPGLGGVSEYAKAEGLRDALEFLHRNFVHEEDGNCMTCAETLPKLRKVLKDGIPHTAREVERVKSLELVVVATREIPDHVWAYPQMDDLRAALDKLKGGE